MKPEKPDYKKMLLALQEDGKLAERAFNAMRNVVRVPGIEEPYYRGCLPPPAEEQTKE